MPKLPPVILASASPRRSQLLRELGIDFKIIPSDAPEVHDEQLSAGEVCQINAYRKARSVAKDHPDDLVIGVDTLVAMGTRLFGKPADLDEARRMIEELQGKTHHVISGVCLIRLREHRQKTFAEWTEVRFRELTTEQICAYHARVNPLDKAGAYAIQEEGDSIVENFTGSYTNVVGLPLERLRLELAEFGMVV